VFFAVEALLHGGRLSLTAMGRAARGPVLPKHSIKRVDRLLGNQHLHREFQVFFRALTGLLLAGQKQPLILVDWTQIDERRYALSAAVPVDGRALPIYWEVHRKEKLGNRRIQLSFLASLTGLVPKRCQPVVVTDAGFTNPWFQGVVDMGWDYVGRLRGRVNYRCDERDNWTSVSSLHAKAGRRTKEIGWCEVGESNRICTRVILAKRFHRNPRRSKAQRRRTDRGRGYRRTVERSKLPWVLSTSLAGVKTHDIIRIYAQRMQIEESYRDTKSHRFGWSFRDAKATTSQRFEALLLIASLAMLALTLIGMCAETQGWHRGYQANTVRSHRVLSLFYLGKMCVERQEVEAFLIGDLRDALNTIRSRIRTLTPVIINDFVGIT